LRETIGNNGDKGKQPNERQQLLDEIQKVKEEQQAHKESRGKIFDQMKASQESLKKKVGRLMIFQGLIGNFPIFR